MKKILLAFDGIRFSEGAFAFARRLNELQPALVVGVFLPQVSLSSLWSYGSAAAGAAYVPLLEPEDSNLVNENISRFENLCQENGMRYQVHKDYFDLAIPELLKETRYADLLIIGSEVFYQQLGNDDPEGYLRELLNQSACPVLVVPEAYAFPNKNILAYDGSESSVYAIKQFAYLFPELIRHETLLVFMKEDADKGLPAEGQIMELTSEHFPQLELFRLDVNPKKYFNNWVSEHSDAVLVCGAYGRSMLSQLLRKSFVTEVIADHRLPVFVAHR